MLLLGIVKKNAIMMIDFALEAERNEGLDPKTAIHRAGLLRFRPILMTTLAALFGALPMAIGLGAGSELRRPLGISIVGGLCVSQILNLFSTPVIYLYLDRLRRQPAARAGVAPGVNSQYPKGLFGGGVAPGAPVPVAGAAPPGRGCDRRRRHGGPARRKRLSRRTGAAGRHRRSNRDVGRPRKRRRRRLPRWATAS